MVCRERADREERSRPGPAMLMPPRLSVVAENQPARHQVEESYQQSSWRSKRLSLMLHRQCGRTDRQSRVDVRRSRDAAEDESHRIAPRRQPAMSFFRHHFRSWVVESPPVAARSFR